MSATLTSTDPATGEALGSVEAADAECISCAFECAREAQPEWARRDLEDRLEPLVSFQRALLAERKDMARLITRESGKPLVESLMADILTTLDQVKFLATRGADVLAPEEFHLGNVLLKDRVSRVERAPLGVVGIIAPWNYPLAIPATQTLAALFAGNAVVLKPSEHTPLIAERFVRMLHEAGVPEDVVQVCHGAGATGAALVDAKPDLVVFTGSVPTGKRVAEQCARTLTPVALELGGKDAMVVLEDARVDLAARGAVWGSFTNCGQTCAAVERLYVHEAVADEFISQVVAFTKEIRVGNGLDEDTDMGPLITQAAVERCEEHLQDAVKRGARIECGGGPIPEMGPQFFAPTVLTGADHAMRVMREETFGPLLPIRVVSSDEAAIELANDSAYGLTASVWTRSAKRGDEVARRLHAGTVTINDAVYTYAACETPWGGVRESGLGHTHGKWGLEAMTRLRHTNRARGGRATSPWYYPYDEDLRKLMDDGLEFLYGKKSAGAKVMGPLARRWRGPP